MRGWTLVEILITVTISAIAGSVLVAMLVSSNTVFFSQSAEVVHGLSLNNSISNINDVIKESVGIASQYPPSGQAQYVTGTNSLVLKLAAYDAASSLIDNIFDYAIIHRDISQDQILRKKIIPDAISLRRAENLVLSTNLKDISFYYFDINGNSVTPVRAARVNFTIILSQIQGNSQKESSASSDVNLKNI